MHLEKGNVAVVTGAASGIGLALANAFAAAGCSVVLADIQQEALNASAAQVGAHGVDVLTVVTDVSKVEQVDALAAATLERFGAVHVLCNNAGVGGAGDPWIGPLETWEWVMGVNFWGVVHGVRAFLPHIVMSGGGHIVNTASIAGVFPGMTAAPYDASKHAVVGMSEALYLSLRAGELPVGVSCLCPGWVSTGIGESERNWPDELGELPERDAGSEVAREVSPTSARRGTATVGRCRHGAQRRHRGSILGLSATRVPRLGDCSVARHRGRSRPDAGRACSRHAAEVADRC